MSSGEEEAAAPTLEEKLAVPKTILGAGPRATAKQLSRMWGIELDEKKLPSMIFRDVPVKEGHKPMVEIWSARTNKATAETLYELIETREKTR